MNDSQRLETVEKLKLELSILRDGGYGRSVRTPRIEPLYLRDSVTCLNFGRTQDREPCNHCFLMEFVPQQDSHQELPCHYIPLNKAGDSIASLEARGEKLRLEETLSHWLESMIRELESDSADR